MLLLHQMSAKSIIAIADVCLIGFRSGFSIFYSFSQFHHVVNRCSLRTRINHVHVNNNIFLRRIHCTLFPQRCSFLHFRMLYFALENNAIFKRKTTDSIAYTYTHTHPRTRCIRVRLSRCRKIVARNIVIHRFAEKNNSVFIFYREVSLKIKNNSRFIEIGVIF